MSAPVIVIGCSEPKCRKWLAIEPRHRANFEGREWRCPTHRQEKS